MDMDMFNTLVGPLLFCMIAGVWGFLRRPEKRDQLLTALMLLFVMSGAIYARFPSTDLFQILVVYALVVSGLYVWGLQQIKTSH